MDKKYSAQIKLSLAALILFIGTFIAGTFCDRAAAETLFSPDNTIAKLITMLGIYPFYAAQVLFCGALFQQIINLNKRSPFRMSMCAACVFWAVFIGYIGGRSLTSANNLGSIFPSVTGSLPVIIILSMILMYPLFFVGYSASKKSEDKLLARRILGLFCVLLIAYISMELLKNSFQRPRYRTAVLGYDGIPFVPWYRPFEGAKAAAAEYGLSADEFRSFPSGHSIFSMLSMCILPSLAWLFPKFEDKHIRLFFCGIVFGIIIMATRIILGAHYLSDTSAGAVIGTLSSIAFSAIQIHISKKQLS